MIKRQAEGCGFLPVSMHTDAEWKYAANAARGHSKEIWQQTRTVFGARMGKTSLPDESGHSVSCFWTVNKKQDYIEEMMEFFEKN